MNPKLHALLRLSPIALSTAMALVIVHGTVPTPWSPIATVLANHCSPPPACDTSCYTCDNCQCAGCGYTDDRDSCER